MAEGGGIPATHRRRLVAALGALALLLLAVLALALLARHDVQRTLAVWPEATRLECEFCGVSLNSNYFPGMWLCAEFGFLRDEQGRVIAHISWSLLPFRQVRIASG